MNCELFNLFTFYLVIYLFKLKFFLINVKLFVIIL